jgi:hypothetical protein
MGATTGGADLRGCDSFGSRDDRSFTRFSDANAALIFGIGAIRGG